MVLPGVDLFLEPAHARCVRPYDDKEILRVKAKVRVGVDDLDVRQPLSIRANLVLTLYDQHAVLTKDAVSLTAGSHV